MQKQTQSTKLLQHFNHRRCLSAVAGIFLISACDSTSSINVLPIQDITPATISPEIGAAEAITRELTFEFDFSAQVTGSNALIANDGREIRALATGILTGDMLIENIDTGERETRPWSIEVAEDFFTNAVSLVTLPLKEGRYDFTMSVIRDGHQYIGTASHVVSEDTQHVVPMITRPVIGNSLVDVTVAENLTDFGFNYSSAEINAAGLIEPIISISIDGGPSTQFLIDPATGLSDDILLVALPPGNYNFSMELFDSGYLLGKSVTEQELVTVSPGADITMDIAPQYGELKFDLVAEGADAPVEVNIPSVVVDEAGGIGNLLALLRVVGPSTPFTELPLNLVTNGSDYSASVVIPQLVYDELTFELKFHDIPRDENIGSCIDTITVNALPGTVNCALELKRRSVITGSLLSTVGVNVFGNDGIPLPGAVVKINGEEAGITATSGFHTPGYIELNVKPGQHIISAEFGAESGELAYESIPLNVTSLNLSMGQTANTAPYLLDDPFNGSQTGSVAPVGYWFGCNGSGSPQYSHLQNGKLELRSIITTAELDFCFGTSAVTDHSFTDVEITDAGGFQVSADIAWSDHTNSNLAIGIGEEPGNDPFNFDPIPSLDAIVDVYGSEIVVRIFDNGTATSVSTYPMPLPISALDNVTIDVQTNDFAAGSTATLRVYINGNPDYVPATIFAWDGGSNHIEVRGGSTDTENAMIALDRLTIRPR